MSHHIIRPQAPGDRANGFCENFCSSKKLAQKLFCYYDTASFPIIRWKAGTNWTRHSSAQAFAAVAAKACQNCAWFIWCQLAINNAGLHSNSYWDFDIKWPIMWNLIRSHRDGNFLASRWLQIFFHMTTWMESWKVDMLITHPPCICPHSWPGRGTQAVHKHFNLATWWLVSNKFNSMSLAQMFKLLQKA